MALPCPHGAATLSGQDEGGTLKKEHPSEEVKIKLSPEGWQEREEGTESGGIPELEDQRWPMCVEQRERGKDGPGQG